jgi:hypothetical protein
MPLPNVDQWERRDEPVPVLGCEFYCVECGATCRPKWIDYGPVLCEGQEHHWGWRSMCCGAAYYENQERV